MNISPFINRNISWKLALNFLLPTEIVLRKTNQHTSKHKTSELNKRTNEYSIVSSKPTNLHHKQYQENDQPRHSINLESRKSISDWTKQTNIERALKNVTYQKVFSPLSDCEMINKPVLIDKEPQRQQNLNNYPTLSRMSKMLLLFLPPRLPTLLRRYTNPTNVVYPLVPISPIINNLLPLKTRRIEQERRKKPSADHEPHRYGDQKIRKDTSISASEDLVHNEQQHHLKPFYKMASGIESVVISELGVEDDKPSACGPVLGASVK